MEKHMNIPSLRFPEFTEKWNMQLLGDITSWASGGTPPKDKLDYWNGDIPWITASSMRGIEYSKSELKITEEGLKRGSKLAPKGSLLLLVRGSMLFNKIPIGIAIRDVAFNQDVKSIEIKKKNNTRFILYWFFASEHKLLNMVTGTGIGAGKLDLDDLKKLPLFIPESSEQTKIASFLGAIDDNLTQLKKKKSLLEQYKKGVMQQIFSQELRFKDEDGNDFADWGEKSLGEISDNIMYGMNAAAITYDGVNKYIRITDIDEESRCFLPNPLTSPDGEIEEKYKLKDGDILFARTGASVGKSYLYNTSDGNVLFAGFLIKFSITKANPQFVFQQMMLESYDKWVQKMSMRSGQPGINAEEYKTLTIFLSSLPEQTKIATFLSALDTKIAQTALQIDKLQLWKKGLLQQMFV